jgi:hypothetical protein
MESMEGYPPLLEVLSTEDEIEAAISKPDRYPGASGEPPGRRNVRRCGGVATPT